MLLADSIKSSCPLKAIHLDSCITGPSAVISAPLQDSLAAHSCGHLRALSKIGRNKFCFLKNKERKNLGKEEKGFVEAGSWKIAWRNLNLQFLGRIKTMVIAIDERAHSSLNSACPICGMPLVPDVTATLLAAPSSNPQGSGTLRAVRKLTAVGYPKQSTV